MTIRNFIQLEWKQFSRSSYFQKGLFIKILMILGALYFSGLAILMGVGVYFIVKKEIPETDPIESLNNYIIYWIMLDILLRYFMQQLPVMNIKPMMIIPVKKQSVIRFLLLKTSTSFFNILPVLFFLPLSIVLLINGYSPVNVCLWFVGLLCISFSINFLNFLINKNTSFLFGLLSLATAGFGLRYFNIFDVTEYSGAAFFEQ